MRSENPTYRRWRLLEVLQVLQAFYLNRDAVLKAVRDRLETDITLSNGDVQLLHDIYSRLRRLYRELERAD